LASFNVFLVNHNENQLIHDCLGSSDNVEEFNTFR